MFYASDFYISKEKIINIITIVRSGEKQYFPSHVKHFATTTTTKTLE